MNFFLEDDDELKRKKKDDESDDDEDDKKKDDEDDDNDTSSNDYLDTDSDDDDSDDSFEDDSKGKEDKSDGNDYLSDTDDGDSDDNEDYSSNNYIGDDESDDDYSGDPSSECSNMLVKLAYAVAVATNNFRHVHLMVAGKKFDNVHSFTDNLCSIIGYWVDTIAELALEDEGVEIDNLSNAAKYVPEMKLETEKTYDYETGCTAVSETLRVLIEIAKQVRSSCEEKPHVQSKIDDYLLTLNKQYNFIMKRRMKNVDESVSYNDYF